MTAGQGGAAELPERKDPDHVLVGRAINQALYNVDRRRADDLHCTLTWEDLAGGYLIGYLFDRGWSIVQEEYVKALVEPGAPGAEEGGA